ncbi:MAG: C25 family cysteine peptidase [Dysgonamonadaceae bacterium]|jgi:hypothetical protein|nr:C25 family cysteine peptidase [Dysgonamonadaceae bacterium]
MKKLIVTVLCIILCFVSMAQSKTISLNNSNKSSFEIKQVSKDILSVKIEISSIEIEDSKQKREENFITLNSRGLMPVFYVGKPNIPVYSRLIEIPLEATVSYKVKNYEEKIIELASYGFNKKIAPAQPSVSKSEEPDEFYFDEKIYNENQYLYSEILTFEEVGIMRSSRLGRIEICPIQYNPVRNELRILSNLEILVEFEGANHVKTSQLKTGYSNSIFDNFLNGIIPHLSQQQSTIDPTYVIISDRKFENTLAPFIVQKQQKGFNVIVGYTDEANVGTTTTSIKTYLQNLYENPPYGYSPPTYALLVGDVAEIPAFQQSGHVTDLYYFDYTGDNLPDVFYGRFSATNTSQLIPQIEKTIEYENNAMPDTSYLSNAVLVAGADNSYMTYSNGQMNYAANEYFNSGNDITAYVYLQPEPSGANYSASIKSNISDGVGFANYSAHCSSSGWASPSFTTGNIAGLLNIHKYGLWVGNCCQSSKFEVSECFAEAALRASNKGAVGYIGASNNTYWSEDYWWSVGFKTVSLNPSYDSNHLGAYDRLFHTHNENPSDWCTTQGQLFVGGNLAVEESTSSKKLYYWEIYNLMGDPSLTVKFAPDCTGIYFTDQTVTTDTTVTSCGDINVENVTVTNSAILTLQAVGDVNVQNVTVINSSKLIIEAGGEVSIIKDFEVELGSELEIQ